MSSDSVAEQVEQKVEEKKRKLRRVPEEDFEVGRILGVIARKHPELYAELQEYAESTGKKMSELLSEALAVYYDYIHFKNVDSMCLVSALRLLEMLLQRLVDFMMTLNQFFTSEFFRQQIEILSQIQQQRQQIATEAVEQTKKEESKSKMVEVKSRITELAITTMMNLVSTMISNLTRMYGGQQIQAPMSATGIGTGMKGVKIVRSAESKEKESKGESK